MRRDLVVQIIVDYGEFWENFSTPYEAESFINANVDDLDCPVRVWMEDMHGHKKWDYDVVDDGSGYYQLISKPIDFRQRLIRTTSN